MSFHFYTSNGTRSFLANDCQGSDGSHVDKIFQAGDGWVSGVGCIDFARSYARWAGSQARIDFADSAAWCRTTWKEMSASFVESDKRKNWEILHLIVAKQDGVYSVNHDPDGGDNFQHYVINDFVCNRLLGADLQIALKHLREAKANLSNVHSMHSMCDRLYRELSQVNHRVSAEWQGFEWKSGFAA